MEIMIIIFDYLLYFIYSTYKRFGENDIPLLYSIAIISIFQGFNIIVILDLVNLFVYDLSNFLINKWYLIVGVSMFIINAFIYLHKKRSQLVLEKYSNQSNNKLKYLIIVYAILSIISIIIVANLKRAMVFN
jgi:hypothetical protein